MYFNYNQLVDHNKTFWESMVDLKVEGWKSYSKAVNAYTNSFYKTQLDTVDTTVEKIGSAMKGKYNV
jgi:hypothetical protein